MIAELRLYRHAGPVSRRESVDVVRISVTDGDALKALDGVLDMAKVHRERLAADRDKPRPAAPEDDDEEDEELI